MRRKENGTRRSASQDGHGPAGEPAAPPLRSLEDIPNLGPIRIRALRRAGFNTPADVRGATVETLGAIRGITPIKAQQMLDYLAAVPDAAPEPEPEPEEHRLVPHSYLAHTLATMVTMLVSAPPDGFRSRLLVAVQILARALDYAASSARLPDPLPQPLIDALQDAYTGMEELSQKDGGDRKAQGRLAKNLMNAVTELLETVGLAEEE